MRIIINMWMHTNETDNENEYFVMRSDVHVKYEMDEKTSGKVIWYTPVPAQVLDVSMCPV